MNSPFLYQEVRKMKRFGVYNEGHLYGLILAVSIAEARDIMVYSGIKDCEVREIK